MRRTAPRQRGPSKEVTYGRAVDRLSLGSSYCITVGIVLSRRNIMLEAFLFFLALVVVYLTWQLLVDPPIELPFLEGGEGRYIIELSDCESCDQRENCPLYEEDR